MKERIRFYCIKLWDALKGVVGLVAVQLWFLLKSGFDSWGGNGVKIIFGLAHPLLTLKKKTTGLKGRKGWCKGIKSKKEKKKK